MTTVMIEQDFLNKCMDSDVAVKHHKAEITFLFPTVSSAIYTIMCAVPSLSVLGVMYDSTIERYDPRKGKEDIFPE